ncbi:MAG: DUF5053 domain-containing protein [Tannerellaceae bacterium]|jgi:hypothetical protein|nr:DUF5053 domain-containing protein [Tannerellaceae bacterium]
MKNMEGIKQMVDVDKLLPSKRLREEFERFEAMTVEEQKDFKTEVVDYFSSLTDEGKQAYVQDIQTGIDALVGTVSDLKERLKEREIFDALSMNYIAKTYFNKSASWLYHRLNGNTVKGKVVQFSEKEKQQFAEALRDLSRRLEDTAGSFA